MFETENKAVDDAQTSLGDWGNARMDQQVKKSYFLFSYVKPWNNFGTTYRLFL